MKTQYLAAMDIVAWRLRPASSLAQPKIYCYRLLTTQDKYLGTLLAEAGSAAEYELLLAILQSLGVKIAEAEWSSSSRLILLGDHLAKNYQAEWTMTIPSLADMLATPLLKSKAWQGLQGFLCG